MKLIFRKTHDYQCENCNKQFNWNEESLVWGKAEYKTIQEKKRDQKFFCSRKCGDEFLNNKKNGRKKI